MVSTGYDLYERIFRGPSMTMPDLPQVEVAIIQYTNAFRTENRLGTVVPNARLSEAARAFAQYLARTGKFSHTADGRGPADRTQQFGYKHCFVGENLALNADSRGFETRGLAFEAVDGWKKSPSHRENMLQPHVVEIGVGVARSQDAVPRYVSVQLFGRPDSMAYNFRVENRAHITVRYQFDKDVGEVQPNMQVQHQVCHPAQLVFDTAPLARFTAKDGVTYTLTDKLGGGVKINAMKGGVEVASD
jgi:uncharacterized protein YkwD